ncbi:hypothetical protein [Pseudomonas sp. 5P_3.1_Bac2]|uniref:hypothetical protein n=1 Tax=Pseudomonas sp. 5P_3.1_Bac2 TaxID=2971617 RepID=UPI0021C61C49|nr:hypothetical protein [Pseudomonas sp. 5P_3.1_Bac2]MCU1716200.1 hypothetical protein [Pseudomonas sp. 5P_3.1_Bac2]
MKLSDGFDARRLRPRGRRTWLGLLGAVFAALLVILGVVLAAAGIISIISQPSSLASLNQSPIAAALAVLGGLLLSSAGVLLWRSLRRRLRRNSDLSMAPHLMKKRD